MAGADQKNLVELARALRPALSLGQSAEPTKVSIAMAEYAIHRHRVGPMLHVASSAQDNVQFEDGADALLEASYKRNAVADLRQRAVEQKLVQALGAEGISFSLIKGRGLAEQLFSDGIVRQAKDIDILIAEAQFGKAVEVFKESGLERKPKGLSESKLAGWYLERHEARFLKDLTFVDRTHSVTVELHQRLFRFEPKGFTVDFLDGTGFARIPELSSAHYCLYLLLHGSISFWHRLKWVADMSLLVRRMDQALLEETFCLAAKYRSIDAIVAALMLIERVFPDSLNEGLVETLARDRSTTAAAELLSHYWTRLSAPCVSKPKLPLKAYLSSGNADLIFPRQLPFFRNAAGRWLMSLSIRI